MDGLNLALIGVFASAFAFRWIEERSRRAFNRLAASVQSRLARAKPRVRLVGAPSAPDR
jgi:hypothetical protein